MGSNPSPSAFRVLKAISVVSGGYFQTAYAYAFGFFGVADLEQVIVSQAVSAISRVSFYAWFA